MDRRAKIDIRGTYRNHSPVFNDTRNGLGYGLAIPSGKFEPRPLQQSFPYLDEDPFEIDADTEVDEEELDNDIESKILSKLNTNVFATDPYPGADPFYYVGGNTKLSETPAVAKNSIVAIPGLYKGSPDGPAVGGFSTARAYTPGSYKRTGSKQGYFSPPPPVDIPTDHELVTFNLRDMLDDDELAMAKLKALRDYIDMIAHEAK